MVTNVGLLPHTAVQPGTVGTLMWAGMHLHWRHYAQGHRSHGAQQKAAA